VGLLLISAITNKEKNVTAKSNSDVRIKMGAFESTGLNKETGKRISRRYFKFLSGGTKNIGAISKDCLRGCSFCNNCNNLNFNIEWDVDAPY